MGHAKKSHSKKHRKSSSSSSSSSSSGSSCSPVVCENTSVESCCAAPTCDVISCVPQHPLCQAAASYCTMKNCAYAAGALWLYHKYRKHQRREKAKCTMAALASACIGGWGCEDKCDDDSDMFTSSDDDDDCC